MASQEQRGENEPDLKVQNTIVATTVSKVVQARTITGGIHHHRHPPPPPAAGPTAVAPGAARVRRPCRPPDVLGVFLDALGVDRDRQPTDPDRRAELYRSMVADKRMLVVLDNAATTDQVTPLLPGGQA